MEQTEEVMEWGWIKENKEVLRSLADVDFT